MIKHLNNNKTIILICLVVLSVLFHVITLKNDHSWGDDFSAYLSQAEAIAQNNIDQLEDASNFRVRLSEIQVGPNLYPWGYPLIITFFIYFFGINIVLLKVVNLVFFIGSLVICYFLFKKFLSKNSILAILLLLSLSPYFFSFKQEILSDIPSMFFLLMSLLLIQNYIGQTKPKNPTLFFLGATIFASVFIRTSAFIIIPTLLLTQLINYKQSLASGRKIIISSIPYFTFLAFFAVSGLIFPASSYSENHTLLAPNLSLLIINVQYYSKLLIEFFGHPDSVFSQFLYFGSIPFFVFGVIANYRKNYVYLIYGALTLIMFLAYPYQQGLRFIISLIPLYMFFVVAGIQTLKFDGISSTVHNVLKPIALILIVVFFLKSNINSLQSPTDGPYTPNAVQLFEHIKNNTQEDATISFFKPRAMYLYTERNSLRIDSKTALSKSKIDYVVFTKQMNDQKLGKFLDQNYAKVFSNETFYLYDLKKDNSLIN